MDKTGGIANVGTYPVAGLVCLQCEAGTALIASITEVQMIHSKRNISS